MTFELENGDIYIGYTGEAINEREVKVYIADNKKFFEFVHVTDDKTITTKTILDENGRQISFVQDLNNPPITTHTDRKWYYNSLWEFKGSSKFRMEHKDPTHGYLATNSSSISFNNGKLSINHKGEHKPYGNPGRSTTTITGNGDYLGYVGCFSSGVVLPLYPDAGFYNSDFEPLLPFEENKTYSFQKPINFQMTEVNQSIGPEEQTTKTTKCTVSGSVNADIIIKEKTQYEIMENVHIDAYSFEYNETVDRKEIRKEGEDVVELHIITKKKYTGKVAHLGFPLMVEYEGGWNYKQTATGTETSTGEHTDTAYIKVRKAKTKSPPENTDMESILPSEEETIDVSETVIEPIEEKPESTKPEITEEPVSEAETPRISLQVNLKELLEKRRDEVKTSVPERPKVTLEQLSEEKRPEFEDLAEKIFGKEKRLPVEKPPPPKAEPPRPKPPPSELVVELKPAKEHLIDSSETQQYKHALEAMTKEMKKMLKTPERIMQYFKQNKHYLTVNPVARKAFLSQISRLIPTIPRIEKELTTPMKELMDQPIDYLEELLEPIATQAKDLSKRVKSIDWEAKKQQDIQRVREALAETAKELLEVREVSQEAWDKICEHVKESVPQQEDLPEGVLEAIIKKPILLEGIQNLLEKMEIRNEGLQLLISTNKMLHLENKLIKLRNKLQLVRDGILINPTV